MNDFVQKLKEDVLAGMRKIDRKDAGKMERALACSRLYSEAYIRLRTYMLAYEFKDDAEEIHFFKHVKPQLCSQLIYHRKVYNFELNRPVGGCEVQRRYLNRELDRIQEFIDMRREFYGYYRTGATHLDHLYFKRGEIDTNTFLEISRHERDPELSSDCDYKASRILANDMFRKFLEKELMILEGHVPIENEDLRPRRKIYWKLKKVFLIELAYALHWRGAFGDACFQEVLEVLEDAFNIDLGSNPSRSLGEMRTRDEAAPLLESLLDVFLARIQRKRNKKKRNNSNGDN